MSAPGLVRELGARVTEHVEADDVRGLVVAVHQGEETCVEGHGEMAADAVVRISSMTKPIIAALALMLVEDGALGLRDPVERWVPELADRRVVTRLDAAVTDTVPAAHPILLEDLLTMRMGFGFVPGARSPVFEEAQALGLGFGPPEPELPVTPDEWIERFARLPLMHQPGEDWMYELSFGVLGVVLARCTGVPLDVLLRSRVLAPLGMEDTGFCVPTHALDRLVPCHGPASGAVFDAGGGRSRWVEPPAFPDARGGLVSTAADFLRFARMLLAGGGELLSQELVGLMTTNRLRREQRTSRAAAMFLGGDGWGYGVGTTGVSYGWGGGLGTVWDTFPEHDTIGLVLTQRFPPAAGVIDAFRSGLREAIGVGGDE